MPGYATYSYDSINSSFQPRKELAYDRVKQHSDVSTQYLPGMLNAYAYPEIVKAGDRLVSLGRYM